MPNIGGQKYKILVLYKILLEQTDENSPMNATKIIEALEQEGLTAERKTIYKDIETLREAGLDIISGADGFYVGSRTFELAELKLLVDAVGASKFISEKKSKILMDKICTMASKNQATQLYRQVIVPDRVKTDNEKIFYTIDTIYKCIDDNKRMSFQYEEWTVNKEKTLRKNGRRYLVSPAFLIRNDENYYLVAYDHESNEIRHYRVDKIVSATEEKEFRGGNDTRKEINKVEYAKKHVSMFAGVEQTITIKCENYLIGVLLDKFGIDILVRQLDDKYVSARINVAVSPQLFGWLTGIGAVITAPSQVVDSYKSYLENQIKMME